MLTKALYGNYGRTPLSDRQTVETFIKEKKTKEKEKKNESSPNSGQCGLIFKVRRRLEFLHMHETVHNINNQNTFNKGDVSRLTVKHPPVKLPEGWQISQLTFISIAKVRG